LGSTSRQEVEEVTRVLLILSATRMSASCIDAALAAAEREQAELVVLYILDTLEATEVEDRILHEGFLGEAPSGKLLRAVRRERKRQGMQELADVARKAESAGVPCRTDLVEGEFVSRSLDAAQLEAPAVIYVARRERPALSRLVAGSPVEELKEAAPCEVQIHECMSDT
jgi:nucleotide-binding universal stress UspA family protein